MIDQVLTLSQKAFRGKAVFLLEAAMAADFSADTPIIPNRKRPSTYCYFIGSESGPIKIGTARDPYQRLITLQCGNPEPLYIYAVSGGGSELESELHSEFDQWRYNGEWFVRSEPILHRILLWQQQERNYLEGPQLYCPEDEA